MTPQNLSPWGFKPTPTRPFDAPKVACVPALQRQPLNAYEWCGWRSLAAWRAQAYVWYFAGTTPAWPPDNAHAAACLRSHASALETMEGLFPVLSTISPR